MHKTLFFAAMGLLFGLILSRSGAADYNMVQGMFLMTEFQLYGIIGTAVALTAPGMWLLKRRGRTASGEPLVIKPKAAHRGNVVGGALFGMGWALTGMCPGPIIVNMGEGKIYAIAAFFGVLAGAMLLGRSYEWFQPRLGLPALQEGTGCG